VALLSARVAVLAATVLLVPGVGSLAASPPDFIWAVAGGGPGPDDADGVGVDPRGRPIISGGFAGPGTAGADVFATGYTRRGQMRWTRQFGGSGADHAFDNDVDSAGAALVTGSFNRTVDFGTATLTSRGGTLPRYGDAFLLKLGVRGGTKWVRQIGGAGSDGGDEVAMGPRDDVFVIGDSDRETRLGADVVLPATGGRDAWAARYRRSGRLKWGRRLGGPGEQQSHGISADGEGHTLVTGEMSGTSEFGSHQLDSPTPRSDVFLAKLGRGGGVRWVQRFGGAGREIGRGVDADADGHIYFSGEFEGALRLGATTLQSAGSDDLFFAKANGRGGVRWAIGFGGPGAEIGPELEVDRRGFGYLTGTFSGTARFGNRTLTASGARAAFVMKVSPRGRIVWVASSGAGPDATLGELALGPGSVTALGRFVATVTLGRFELASAGGTDFFLARLPR
jgi:hypothetical protein